jgi:hypothetical protein
MQDKIQMINYGLMIFAILGIGYTIAIIFALLLWAVGDE